MIPVAASAFRHRRLIVWAAAVAVLAVVASVMTGLLGLTLLAGASGAQTTTTQPVDGDPVSYGGGCTVPTGPLPAVITVPGQSPEQNADSMKVAAAIVSVSKGLGLPIAAAKVGIMTGLVESHLHELPYGDRDSLGVFQQRAPWGPAADRIAAASAARMFFEGGQGGQPGLVDQPNWQNRAVTSAGALAQAVQVSAFPLRYAAEEQLAVQYVAALSGVTAGLCPAGGGNGAGGPLLPGQWTTPEAKGSYVITSEYGMRVNPATGVYNLHGGTDFAGACGTPEVAAGPGTVTHAGPGGAQGGWAGNWVQIDHGGGFSTLYAHQQQTVAQVGQQVQAGTLLGYEGTTGNSTGCHLHFETRVNDQPVPTRPFMAQRGVTF